MYASCNAYNNIAYHADCYKLSNDQLTLFQNQINWTKMS